MVLRILFVLVASFLISEHVRADCTAGTSLLAKMICADGALRALERDVVGKYQETLTSIDRADRPSLEAEQVAWRLRWPIICPVAPKADQSNEKKARCVRSMLSSRLKRLAEWRTLGHTIVADNSVPSKAVCPRLLARDNIRWMGREEVFNTDDNFSVEPSIGARVGWKPIRSNPDISKARFDFLNDGTVRDVYSVTVENNNYLYHWYIVVATGEESLMADRIFRIRSESEDDVRALGRQLDHEVISGTVPEARRDVFANKGRTRTLRSMLFDASNTGAFDGWYTRSFLLRDDGVTYIVAESVNNSIGPTAAVFRPRETGQMDLICEHNAIPSYERAVVTMLNDRFSCPNTLEHHPIAWRDSDNEETDAVVDLKEWGGKRIVIKRLEYAGMRYSTTRTSVGPIEGQSSTGDEHWASMERAGDGHDSIELYLTDAGPYVVVEDWLPARPGDAPPLGNTFYRVTENSLVEVCRVTSETVAPPGYAVKD
jgi:hypothetical protein